MAPARPEGSPGPRPHRRRRAEWRAALVPALISLASIVVVFGALAWFVTSAEQWPRIRHQFFNIEAMQASFPRVLAGFWVSMRVWLTALVCIAIWALVLAVLRSLRAPVFAPFRLMVVIYIDFFRGVPVLLLVLLFGSACRRWRCRGCPIRRCSGGRSPWC